MKTTIAFCTISLLALFSGYTALGHCQVPCGIYGDETRFTLLKEHVQTIEKSMKQITELEQAEKVNSNQLIRWVNTKDDHADKLTEIVTYYFLAQRVKPVAEGDTKERAEYVKKLELLHNIMVHAMKSKQTTDTAHTAALTSLINEFEQLYFCKTDHVHDHGHGGHTH